jgi:DNA polymerase-3 subunit alpha
VEKFAGYGFNKSHSAAYALVSYQTLWLKTHYPAEFMAAVMTADMDNTEKVVGLVEEAHRMQITVLPPDVNKGLYRFNVDDNGAIVYGIGAIKGVGEGPLESIIKAREDNGHFKNLFDFCARVDTKKVNKRVLERLIKAGALDKLGPNRAAIMASLDEAIRAAGQHHQAEKFGQADMFGVLTAAPEAVEQAYANIPEWPEMVRLDGEKETLGLYLTGHPIDQYLKELKHYTQGRLKDLHPTKRDQSISVAGLVVQGKVMTTKRGSKIGLMTLDDRSGRLEVMLFSEALEKYQHLIEKDSLVVVSGQVSFDDYNGGLRMSAREVLSLSQAREKHVRSLGISMAESQIDSSFFDRLQQILSPYRDGIIPIHVYYQGTGARVKLTFGTQWRITPTDDLIQALQGLLGEKQVELEFH